MPHDLFDDFNLEVYHDYLMSISIRCRALVVTVPSSNIRSSGTVRSVLIVIVVPIFSS